MALRMELSGFLISCATSAANRSMASMRPHSAVAESDKRLAQLADLVAPAQQRRRHRAGAAMTLAHVARRVGQQQDRPRDASATDTRTAAPSAPAPAQNRPRMEMRTANRLSSTSRRVARQQHDADRMAVALHRLGHRHQQPVLLGAPDIGRHLVAVVAAGQAQFLGAHRAASPGPPPPVPAPPGWRWHAAAGPALVIDPADQRR